MIIGEIMAIIDGIGRVKNLLLNEEEKQIVKVLILSLDQGNLFNPKKNAKYAFVHKNGNLNRLRHYQKYLNQHAHAITKVIGAAKQHELVEKLEGLRNLNKEFKAYDEEFDIEDDNIKLFIDMEYPPLRNLIDYYRGVMSYSILTLIESVDINISTVNIENFRAIIELTRYAFND